jgi:hypothetical protein
MGESYEDLSVVVVVVGLACFCPSVAEARKALKGDSGRGARQCVITRRLQYSYSRVVQYKLQAAWQGLGGWRWRWR